MHLDEGAILPLVTQNIIITKDSQKYVFSFVIYNSTTQ